MLNKGSKKVTMVRLLFFASTEHHAQGDEVGEADEESARQSPRQSPRQGTWKRAMSGTRQ